MKKVIATSLITATMLFGFNFPLNNGWNLVGAVEDINISQVSCVKTAWIYDQDTVNNTSWSLYTNSNYGYNTPSTYGYDSFDLIHKGSGFWVNADTGCDIVFPDNNTSGEPSVVDANISTFFNSFIDVESSMLANKTFKYYAADSGPHAPPTLKTISFDTNGENSSSITGKCNSYYPANDVTVNFSIKIQDGKLQYLVENEVKQEYKILAMNSEGIVFGITDIDHYESAEYYGNTPARDLLPKQTFYFLYENTGEILADMSSKIPYRFSNWVEYDSINYKSYDLNGTVTEHQYGNTFVPQDYTFNLNGALFTQDDGSDITSGWNTTLQAIYTIGDFDIVKSQSESRNYTNGISFDDVNLSNITNWDEYLVSTGNKHSGQTLSGGIINNDGNKTYTISSDRLTLTKTENYGTLECLNTSTYNYIFDTNRITIGSEYRIYSVWGEDSIGLTSQTEVIKRVTE